MTIICEKCNKIEVEEGEWWCSSCLTEMSNEAMAVERMEMEEWAFHEALMAEE